MEKNKGCKMRRIIIALIFGSSLAFTFIAIYKFLNIPYQESIGLLISIMISIQIVNNRKKIFK